MIKNVFKWNLDILTDFRKMLIYQISWKSVKWEPSFSIRTDGQKDTMKLIVAFRNFAIVPNENKKISIVM
jgi:hypothetical protein